MSIRSNNKEYGDCSQKERVRKKECVCVCARLACVCVCVCVCMCVCMCLWMFASCPYECLRVCAIINVVCFVCEKAGWYDLGEGYDISNSPLKITYDVLPSQKRMINPLEFPQIETHIDRFP